MSRPAPRAGDLVQLRPRGTVLMLCRVVEAHSTWGLVEIVGPGTRVQVDGDRWREAVRHDGAAGAAGEARWVV